MEPTALALLRLKEYLVGLAQTAVVVRCTNIRVPLSRVRCAVFPEQKGGEALVALMLPSKVVVGNFSFDVYISKTSKCVYVHLLRSGTDPPDYLVPVAAYRQSLLASRRSAQKWWRKVVAVYSRQEVFRIEG